MPSRRRGLQGNRSLVRQRPGPGSGGRLPRGAEEPALVRRQGWGCTGPVPPPRALSALMIFGKLGPLQLAGEQLRLGLITELLIGGLPDTPRAHGRELIFQGSHLLRSAGSELARPPPAGLSLVGGSEEHLLGAGGCQV